MGSTAECGGSCGFSQAAITKRKRGIRPVVKNNSQCINKEEVVSQEEERDKKEGEEEESGEGDGIEGQVCQDEVKVKVIKDPGLPTPEERERHNMTHNPYRSWCPICVEARGKEDPHRKTKKKEDNDEIPEIGLDYKTFG